MINTPITMLINSVVRKKFSISSTPSRRNDEQFAQRKSSSGPQYGHPARKSS